MTLRARLAAPPILIAPGVFDGLSALIAARAGAKALYLSGASLAYTRYASPDLGLLGMTEVADAIAAIADRVSLPLIVDADTGYGNALNAQRTMRWFERAGASALQFEDQALPKRCGHLEGKALIPQAEMAGKIRAALDARRSAETLVIARTDAIAVEGLGPALERARAYAEAGADVLFVEAPRDPGEIRAIVAALGGLCPLMANMVEGGRTPAATAAELGALGFSLAIFPGGAVRALARCAEDYYASLLAHGANAPFAARMHDLTSLNALIGTPEMLRTGARYGGDEA
jgi:2-methylisocitrate lyase-like PEP mutase family enzyme